jgi:hypothetical protein
MIQNNAEPIMAEVDVLPNLGFVRNKATEAKP